MYTIEELEQEAVKRYGNDWKNVKIKAHADDGSKGGINEGGFCLSIDATTIWGKNGLIYYNGKWAEPLIDGSIREAVGTLNVSYEAKGTAKINYGVMSFWDVNAQGFRSFKIENLIY